MNTSRDLLFIGILAFLVYNAYEWAKSQVLRIQELEAQLREFVSPHPQDVEKDPKELTSCPVRLFRHVEVDHVIYALFDKK